MRPPRSGAAWSAHPVPAVAVGEVVGRLLEAMGTGPDLAIVTVTPALAGAFADIVDAVRRLLRPGTLLGAVVGVGPGGLVGLWAAHVGPVEPFAVRTTDPAAGGLTGLPVLSGAEGGVLVLAGDRPTGRLLAAASTVAAGTTGIPLIGAAIPGPPQGGVRRGVLSLDGRIVDADAVGLVLRGDVEVDVHLTPGTRPVGPPMTVTEVSGSMLAGLDGLAAGDALDRVVAACRADERAGLRRGVHLGVVSSASAGSGAAGEETVGDVVGMDRATRALAVLVPVEVGDAVRFHLPAPSAPDPSFLRSVAGAADAADAALLVTGRLRAATPDDADGTDRSDDIAEVHGLLGLEVGTIEAATPIVSSWGRSYLLGGAGAAVVTIRRGG